MQVTVLMPAFNAGHYIAEAIESVLSQTYSDFELIIINDGSTDNTQSVIENYAQKDKRIQIISHPNIGMGASLNEGLNLANNEWIIRMDADDVMMPNRIERQLNFVNQHPDLAVSASLVYYINEKGKVIGKNSSELKNPQYFQSYLKSNELIGFHHPGVIMRKDVVMSVYGYRPQFWPADDIDLWNRIAERGDLVLLQQEYLLKYRIHDTAISVKGVRLARLKVGWVKQCMLARRRGDPEPSWEGYLSLRMGRPFWAWINQERKDLAKICYKTAVLHYSRRNFYLTFPYLASATLLQPSYVMGQIKSKQVGEMDVS